MNKILWDFIKSKKDKNTVVVNSIEELEKATEKIKSRGEKR